jgi:hypothetical protein
MEFCLGRGNRWFLLAVSTDDKGNKEEMEAFLLDLACELIEATPQKRGVLVVHPTMDEDE